jgi:hypothetical protein
LNNEADILKRYECRTPFIRPIVEGIEDPFDPSSIVLKYLDNDLLAESNNKSLSRPDVKFIARSVLQALAILYKDRMVHIGIVTLYN